MAESSDFFKNFRKQIRDSKVNTTDNHKSEIGDDYDDHRYDILDTIDHAEENKDGFDTHGAYVDDFNVKEEYESLKNIVIFDKDQENHLNPIQEHVKSERRITKKVPILDYIFTPKDNITTYELARLLSFVQMSIDQKVFDNMPIELKKHFTKCID